MFRSVRPAESTISNMERAFREGHSDWTLGLEKNLKKIISRQVHHDNVDILSSGDCAILCAVAAAGGKIMVPDQGGWKGSYRLPSEMGIETCFLETNLGVVDTETLAGSIREEGPKALILTSFAGYIAEQDIKEIAKVCRESEVLLIEDASGSVGDISLADGRYCDILVCSTGSPKVINVGMGGFISTDREDLAGSWKALRRACRSTPPVIAGIAEEMKFSGERLKHLLMFSQELKGHLPNAVHGERRGICVGFKNARPKEVAKRAHAAGLVTDDGRGFLTVCPRYERFNEPGFVVEMKKLTVEDMDLDDVVRMAEILNSVM